MTDRTHRRADNVEAIAAVTPMQQGILFHSLKVREQDPYFIQRVFVVNGPVDAQALQRAWQSVADRHQVLRADYRWEEAAKPAQVIYKSRPVAIANESWRELLPDAQVARLRALLSEERAHGFDLRDASQLRLRVIERRAEQHWLVWSYHHIALDGWSAALILSDVLGAYHAFTTHGSFSPPGAAPYTAYVDWIHKQDPAGALEYWKTLLGGAEIPTPLPHDGARRELGSAERVWKLSRADSELLRKRTGRLGVTLSTLVQGAWALLLGRHAGVSEVVFGTTVSGRSAELPGIDNTAGLFINTLPTVVRLASSTRVRDWLTGIQLQNLDSRRHEHTPLGEIRRVAGVAGDQNLFDSVVVFENYPLDAVLERQPSGLHVQPMAAEEQFEHGVRTTGRNNYALTLNVIPGEQLILTIAHQRERLGDAAIAALGDQLERLLHTLGERPDARLGEVGLAVPPVPELDASPAAQSGALVLQSFLQHVQQTPNAVALQSEARTCTYAELDAASNRGARYLIAQGAGADQRVGLSAERSIEFVIGVLSSWKAGAAYVPFDLKLAAARQAELARESGVLLTLDCSSLEELARPYGDAPLAPRFHVEQAAYLIFTSGSTGRPKAVVVSHGAIARYANGLVEQLGIEPGASFAMVSTVAADLGHTVLLGSLCTGGRLHLVAEERAFDPDGYAEYVAEQGIEVLKIVPSHLAALLHAAEPARVLPKKLLILGGETSDWGLVARVRELAPGCRVVNHYGPTEATVGATFYELNAGASHESSTVPIGRPLAGAALEVLDRDLNRVAAGVAGELYIGGARLARGYFGAPGATAQRFVPDPYGAPGARLYRTGDRVRRVATGELEFIGRVDRQLKLRGYRIEPGEIESKLRECNGVRAAAVVPRESTGGSLQLVAYVVGDVAADALLDQLRGALPDYMVPARIVSLEALPLTRNGKLDHAALPAAAPAQTPADAGAATDVEETLIAIWQAVLRVERVGVLDDFFKLGGDSILSLQVVARARRRGLKVTPQQLFEHRTLRAVAQVATPVQPKAAAVQPPRDEEAPSGSVPLLPIQARFFAREQPEPQRYNQSLMLRTRERLDPAELERALAALLAHHDSLRLRFRRNASGAWEQSYAEPSAPPERVLWVRRVQARTAIEPIADEAHGSLDLAAGPLMRAVLLEGPGDEQRLLLVIHHLVVDGVSWRVVLEDLQASYRRVALPAKTSSLQRWSEKLYARAQSGALTQELPYWLEQLQPGAEGMPRDFAGGKNLVRDEARCRLELSREQTEQLLRQAPEQYGSQVQELLLSALARAMCAHARSSQLLVELESHGREDLFEGVDLSRSVGWFTSVFPVLLTPGRGAIGDSVRAVSTQLRRIPQRGIGFGALRQLAPEAVRARLYGLPAPRLTFNYLGQFDQSFGDDALFEPSRESDGRGQSEHAPRSNWLTITGQVYDGALQLSFAYGRDLYRAETIVGCVRAYQVELEALLAPIESRRT